MLICDYAPAILFQTCVHTFRLASLSHPEICLMFKTSSEKWRVKNNYIQKISLT